MRILQIITELRPAGAETVLLTLARELTQRGHHVHVVSLQPLPHPPLDTILAGLNEAGIPVHSLELTASTPWRALRLRRLVRAIGPDVIHTHLFHANILARILLPKSPFTPLVNSIHVMERRRSRFWHFILDRLTRNRCDAFTAVSASVRNFHAGKIGVDKESFHVVHNGIEPPPKLTTAERKRLRAEWKAEHCTRVLGSAGRLTPQKGYDRLLALLPALGNAIPNGETWGLVILGEGPERGKLERLAARAPANIHVMLPGFRPDAAKCIQAFDLFVMPSRYEGFGLVAAEARAGNVPILANDIRVLREVIAPGDGKSFVDFDSTPTTELARTLIETAANPPASTGIQYAARDMVDNYLNLYRGTM